MCSCPFDYFTLIRKKWTETSTSIKFILQQKPKRMFLQDWHFYSFFSPIITFYPFFLRIVNCPRNSYRNGTETDTKCSSSEAKKPQLFSSPLVPLPFGRTTTTTTVWMKYTRENILVSTWNLWRLYRCVIQDQSLYDGKQGENRKNRSAAYKYCCCWYSNDITLLLPYSFRNIYLKTLSDPGCAIIIAMFLLSTYHSKLSDIIIIITTARNSNTRDFGCKYINNTHPAKHVTVSGVAT